MAEQLHSQIYSGFGNEPVRHHCVQKGLGKMAKKLMTAIAGLAVTLVLTSVARADSISIGLQEAGVDGGAIMTEATGTGTASFFGVYGNFLVGVSGTGTPPSTEPDLGSNSLSLSFSGLTSTTLTIYVTETGITSPIGLTDLLSSFNLAVLMGPIASVVETTEYSNTDALYSGTLLGSQTFTATGSASASTKVTTSAPFSETEIFVITTSGAGMGVVDGNIGIAEGTISKVPEPATLSLLGLGLSSLGLLGLRKKVRQNG